VGEEFGCRKVTHLSQQIGARNVWGWVCGKTGRVGESDVQTMRKYDHCLGCRTWKKKDKVGQRPPGSSRTVVARSERTYGNSTPIWEWVCDCGSTGEATWDTLSKTKNCSNCAGKVSRRFNPGDDYGDHRQVEEVLKGGLRVRCKICGYEARVGVSTDIDKKCRRCGGVDLTGKEINGRVVVGMVDRNTSRNAIAWKLKCPRCGRELVVIKSLIGKRRCLCVKESGDVVNGKYLTAKDAAKLCGRTPYGVKRLLREGWTFLEIILGEKKSDP
jgi:phage FluMu protein Com